MDNAVRWEKKKFIGRWNSERRSEWYIEFKANGTFCTTAERILVHLNSFSLSSASDEIKGEYSIDESTIGGKMLVNLEVKKLAGNCELKWICYPMIKLI